MKRSELSIGEAYYHDRSRNIFDGYGYETGKAVVVDTGYWYGPDKKAPDGVRTAGVLVDLTVTPAWLRGEEVTNRAVVQPAALHGLYDETLAEVTARRDARIERERADRNVKQDLRDAAQSVANRAAQLGIEAFALDGHDAPAPYIGLKVDEFERLLDMATRVAEEH